MQDDVRRACEPLPYGLYGVSCKSLPLKHQGALQTALLLLPTSRWLKAAFRRQPPMSTKVLQNPDPNEQPIGMQTSIVDTCTHAHSRAVTHTPKLFDHQKEGLQGEPCDVYVC